MNKHAIANARSWFDSIRDMVKAATVLPCGDLDDNCWIAGFGLGARATLTVLAVAGVTLAMWGHADSDALATPDNRLTPGDVATDDPDIICQRGYSESQRVWNTQGPAAYYRMRDEAFARYRIAVP